MQTPVHRSMVQEVEAKLSSTAQKSPIGATKDTSSLVLMRGAVVMKESGLGYNLIVLVNTFFILLL